MKRHMTEEQKLEVGKTLEFIKAARSEIAKVDAPAFIITIGLDIMADDVCGKCKLDKDQIEIVMQSIYSGMTRQDDPDSKLAEAYRRLCLYYPRVTT